MRNPPELLIAFVAAGALFLSACETTTRALPAYERPTARNDFQTVRTTAYTHTESDHRQFSNRNALGGELRAAGPAIRRAENIARAIPVSANDDLRPDQTSGDDLQPFSMEPGSARKIAAGGARTRAVYSRPRSGGYGSAAADWARWPAGTIFRLLSTGQVYRVDDYGWALSGRNTIDLYMANQREMNSWGVRNESIEILQWGDRAQSLQFLRSHQDHKHIKRMVLELEGREQEAAALQ